MGIILLNKHKGISSHHALKLVKKLLQVKKAGHTGTLDPLASGMLPICLGEMAKFSQFLLDADKSYRTIMQLGQISTTGDAEGEKIAMQPIPVLNTVMLEQVLEKFRGTITQIPSMYSAIKHQGRPLYEWARQGQTIVRPPRLITIHQLKLIAFTPDTITLDVVCSKGTYIRSLVEDIGKALGCGAYMAELYRTAVMSFHEDQMLSLEDLEAMSYEERHQAILPITAALEHLPICHLTKPLAWQLSQGQKVIFPDLSTGIYQLFWEDQFIGVGIVHTEGILCAKRMLSNIKINRIELQ